MSNETERIKIAYRKRDLANKGKLYSWFNPGSLFLVQQREKHILKALQSLGLTDLSSKVILDLGCGNGLLLREFLKYGCEPKNCHGIDLLSDRIETASKLSSNMLFARGNAEYLPYKNGVFELVLVFTVFTSILDPGMKRGVSREILRVLKNDGVILWFDYFISSPWNPDVKGVGKKEISDLFPNCRMRMKKIGLAPPLARALVPFSRVMCLWLEKFKIFSTHYLGVIQKGFPKDENPG